MKGVYYGWWLVAVAFLTNLLVYGTTYTGFQMFVVPASKDYGLSRADMNTAMVFLSFGSAILAPLLGRLLDFVSPKRVVLAGALLLGGSLAGLGLTRSVWVSAAIFALPLAAAIQCCAQLTLPLLINRWFVRQRGRAMALGIMGISMSFVVVVPIIALLITRFAWRETLMILGAAVTAVLVSLSLTIRDRPGVGEVEPGGPAEPQASVDPAAIGAPLSMPSILRMPQFWTIAVGTCLASAVSTGLVISIVPIAVLRGLPPLQATGLVSIAGMAGIGAKLSLTFLADRINRIYLLAGVFFLGAAANLILLTQHGAGPVLIVAAIAFGASNGALPPLLYALLGDRFGAASFGTAAGMVSTISLVAGAIGSRFAGDVYDRTHSYDGMHLAFTVLGAAACAILLVTRFTRTAAELSRA